MYDFEKKYCARRRSSTVLGSGERCLIGYLVVIQKTGELV